MRHCADIEKFRLSNSTIRVLQEPGGGTSPKRQRGTELFLKGPIPWPWMARAACLPGKTLHVAIAIWLLKGLRKNLKIRLPSGLLEDMGVRRNAKYRALVALEQAGLITVGRNLGKNPWVTIILEQSEGKMNIPPKIREENDG